MAFPDSVVTEAWKRSGGQCECNLTSHGHSWRCPTKLNWGSRGLEVSHGWEAHHVTAEAAGGKDILSNCEILCQECHKKTQSYGG